MIRVLVVDDSAFVRKALRACSAAPETSRWWAPRSTARTASRRSSLLRPDVVTLDVKCRGSTAWRRCSASWPSARRRCCCSRRSPARAPTSRCAASTSGALDFVDKSSVQGHMNLLALADELLRRCAAWPEAHGARRAPAAAPTQLPLPELARGRAELVAIGTSTGGPAALQTVIPRAAGGPARCRC